MKKIGLLLVMCAALAAYAQQPDTNTSTGGSDSETPTGTIATNATFPMERVQTPTYADIYCAGFISKQLLPNANFVAGGLNTPNTTKFVNGDVVYLAGGGYQAGQQYEIVRELVDPNRYEMFAGQFGMLKEMGQPYAELARIRIVDTRSKMAIGQVEFSCDPVSPGDLAVPYVEKTMVPFHPPLRFDRFVPASGKLGGRIVMARDFDSLLGTGSKVYLNAGFQPGSEDWRLLPRGANLWRGFARSGGFSLVQGGDCRRLAENSSLRLIRRCLPRTAAPQSTCRTCRGARWEKS